MVKSINLSKYDVVYLSYDEPNADENYDQLTSIIPYAKRVHGVKGSDSAHKAVARLSDTERFIVIDGDNFLINADLNRQIVTVKDDSVDLDQSVFSWPSYNIINGLVYGNGGIKCWPTDLALSMRTHENADEGAHTTKVDFCWDINYIPLDQMFSEIRNNGSNLQAWRAGFREGVKMSLDRGNKVDSIDQLWHGNLKRLMIWMTVGSDVLNGQWSILGARMGCYMTMCTDWDFVQVRDFEYLNNFWKTEVSTISKSKLTKEIEKYKHMLSDKIEIAEMFTPCQSEFFKEMYVNTPRQSKSVTVKIK